jgi:glutathione S-transferase
LSEQFEPPPPEAPVPTLPPDPERRERAIDEAWEAIVRQELARIRRGHARDRRFTRPEDEA